MSAEVDRYWALTLDGSARIVLDGTGDGPLPRVRTVLSRLGTTVHGLWVAALTVQDGDDPLEVAARADEDPRTPSLQSVGESASRLTVELRCDSADGVSRLWQIGRPGAEAGAVDETVTWSPSRHVSYAATSEIFDAAEAGELYARYLETGDLPAEYPRRDLGFDIPPRGVG